MSHETTLNQMPPMQAETGADVRFPFPRSVESVRQATESLLAYCRDHNWAGYDPYDGLNSPIVKRTLLGRSKLTRLAFIQAVKRCPINLRPLLQVPQEVNPKGIALFVSSMALLTRCGMATEHDVRTLVRMLLDLQSPGQDAASWGYHFDWQTRGVLVPRFSPNIISTTFSANALLDVYDLYGDSTYLEAAVSAGRFLLSQLWRNESDSEDCFRYTPNDLTCIHNANLLGAAFLARLYALTDEQEFIDIAGLAATYSTSRQARDGSWAYGEATSQKWIDSFHTGYNLLALQQLVGVIPDAHLKSSLDDGYSYYRDHFFLPSGAVKYYHNRAHPYDMHAIAHGIITSVAFKDGDPEAMDRAHKAFDWATNHMRSGEGWFYYQKKRLHVVRIPYMRWSQAWMLLALSTLLNASTRPGR